MHDHRLRPATRTFVHYVAASLHLFQVVVRGLPFLSHSFVVTIITLGTDDDVTVLSETCSERCCLK